MESSDIAYVIHIAATPNQVWNALTDQYSLEQKWGRIRPDWVTGSTVAEISESSKILWHGEVVKSNRPKQLAFTFEVNGLDESSEVCFDIDSPLAKVVEGATVARLTMTQAGFKKDSKMYAGCKRAWPEILSNVKTSSRRVAHLDSNGSTREPQWMLDPGDRKQPVRGGIS
jgi:uncharacterized protein YndB with AHSA1/START domain